MFQFFPYFISCKNQQTFGTFIAYAISYSGVSFLYNADVMTSALSGTSKNSKLYFPATASTLEKYFNLRIHQCSISMVSSLFLWTAYMLLCAQTQHVQITL